MFEIFGFIIPLIVILVIVGIFLSFVPLGLWISGGIIHTNFCNGKSCGLERPSYGRAGECG